MHKGCCGASRGPWFLPTVTPASYDGHTVKEFSRWTYLRSLIRWWWGVILAVHALPSLYDLLCGQFVEDAPRLGEIIPWYAWLLSLLIILLVLAFEESYRLHRQLAVSPYESVVSELASQSYKVGGELKHGDGLFKEIGPWFREPISESQIFSYLWEEIAEHNETKAGATPISGELADSICRTQASKILDNWFTMDLLDRATIDPAPGATSSIRHSRHDVPYTAYCLSDHGKAVLHYLKKRRR